LLILQVSSIQRKQRHTGCLNGYRKDAWYAGIWNTVAAQFSTSVLGCFIKILVLVTEIDLPVTVINSRKHLGLQGQRTKELLQHRGYVLAL
jgi:hypothetical protein